MLLTRIKPYFFVVMAAIISCTLLLFVSCKKDPNTLSVSETTLTFSANETDQKTVTITTDASGWEYNVSDPSWIVATRQGANLLAVKVEPYSDTGAARTGTITITAGTATSVNIMIKQDAKISLSISPTSLTFASDETGEKTVTITTTSTNGWDYASSASWLDCSKNNNDLIIKVNEKNNGIQERSAAISVTAGAADPVTLTIIQKSMPNLSISPSDSISFASSDSSITLNITSNTTWTVSSSATDWLTVSPDSGADNGSVTVTASANAGFSRTGAIIVKGADEVTDLTINVTQAGNQNLEVSDYSLNFTNNSQSNTFTITSNVDWTISRGASTWFTVSRTSGSNNAAITVNVQANTSASPRTGTITVSGSGVTHIIDVFQSGVLQQAQVRFRKNFNTSRITQLGVFTTDGSELAAFNFGYSEGVSDYITIISGSHQRKYAETGIWKNYSTLFNFQNNQRYTFELTSEDSDFWFFTTYDDGAVTLRQGAIFHTNPPEVIAIPKNR